jgi:predicted nucleotidyltransferase
MHSINMIILNKGAVDAAMHQRGIKTYSELTKILGCHRNSLSSYLCGKPVVPEVVESLISALGLAVSDALMQQPSLVSRGLPKELLPVVENLVRQNPELSFMLFGSRARGTHRKYSDVDLGVKGAGPVTLEVWSKIRDAVESATEDAPWTVDVVDLGRAPSSFIQGIRSQLVFLGGNPRGWQELVQ